VPLPADIPRSLPLRLLRRLLRLVWSRELFLVYQLDPAALPPAPACSGDIQFRLNCPEAIRILSGAGREYDLTENHRQEMPQQLAGGELLVSGWHDDKLVFYGWAQFRQRRLARLTSIPIGRDHAFIYRCFTHPDFRGRGAYPGALHFLCRSLAARGCTRVFIDHHVRNVSSAKGIRRAGFQPAGQYAVTGLLGLKWAACGAALRRLVAEGTA